MTKTNKRALLCILDGWGISKDEKYNAVVSANTPNFDKFMTNNPHTLIHADGLSVGLPEGQMGNSEVGHTNLGAGRVVMQDLPKIDMAIKDGSLAKNPVLTDMIETLKNNNDEQG